MRGVLLGIAAAAACAGLSVAAHAQVAYPPTVSPIDVQAAIAAATPSACPIPLADTLVGTAGSEPVCMARPDATRPTVVQAKDTVTGTDAAWSVTFDRPFASPPVYVDARIYGSAQPYLCTVQTLSATGASGKCYQLVSTTLPTAAVALLGLVVSPISAAGAGLSVRVVARQ